MTECKERTFIMIKPDGVQRGLIGDVIKRFEQRGFKLVALKLMNASSEIVKSHYAEHVERPFFPKMMEFILSGPVCAMIWEGDKVVESARIMLGKTSPAASKPGTIRGDFGICVGRNICHGSDSVESAKREISIWFKPEELITYTLSLDLWTYE